MSNVAGKAYAMNVVTPMRPWLTWLNGLIFMAARAFPATLAGLLGLSFIHFARWAFIRRDQWPQRGQPPQVLVNDYMLFCSNFNGTWDQYIDAFADGIPSGLNLFWYASTKYPGSIPIAPFKAYIRANQIDTNYYYNATPGSAQRDIKAALALAQALGAVDLALGDAALAEAYATVLLGAQNGLGAAGYAPIASCDTSAADRHRSVAVQQRWGPHAVGQPAAKRMLAAVAPTVVRGPPADMGDEAEKRAVQAAVSAVVDAAPRLDEAPPIAPTAADEPATKPDGSETRDA